MHDHHDNVGRNTPQGMVRGTSRFSKRGARTRKASLVVPWPIFDAKEPVTGQDKGGPNGAPKPVARDGVLEMLRDPGLGEKPSSFIHCGYRR